MTEDEKNELNGRPSVPGTDTGVYHDLLTGDPVAIGVPSPYVLLDRGEYERVVLENERLKAQLDTMRAKLNSIQRIMDGAK